jgi:hypothetical protein
VRCHRHRRPLRKGASPFAAPSRAGGRRADRERRLSTISSTATSLIPAAFDAYTSVTRRRFARRARSSSTTLAGEREPGRPIAALAGSAIVRARDRDRWRHDARRGYGQLTREALSARIILSAQRRPLSGRRTAPAPRKAPPYLPQRVGRDAQVVRTPPGRPKATLLGGSTTSRTAAGRRSFTNSTRSATHSAMPCMASIAGDLPHATAQATPRWSWTASNGVSEITLHAAPRSGRTTARSRLGRSSRLSHLRPRSCCRPFASSSRRSTSRIIPTASRRRSTRPTRSKRMGPTGSRHGPTALTRDPSF